MASTRTAVIASAWLQLENLEPFSRPDGLPLQRTVKCILDPLVIRPLTHPALAKPILDDDDAALVRQRILDRADSLRNAAAWVPILKTRRRALRITEGDAQERCFPLAFELAVTHGAPTDVDDQRALADAILVESHAEGSLVGGTLTSLITDDHERQLAAAWADGMNRNRDWGEFERASTTALIEAVHALGTRHAHDRFERALVNERPVALVEALQYPEGSRALDHAIERALVTAHVEPPANVTLGLTVESIRQPPALRGHGPDVLLERTVERRLRNLERRLQRDVLEASELTDLVSTQVALACSPSGLDGIRPGVALIMGMLLAAGLRPTAPGESFEGSPAVLVEIRNRLLRERFVMRARRFESQDGASVLGDSAGELDAVMRDLIEFHRPFLQRLWTRLHTIEPESIDATSVHHLLTGIARSTSLDLRTRIRRSLERSGRAS